MKLEIYKDKAGKWRWRLTAKNGRILAVSSEAYETKAKCKRGIELTAAGLSECEANVVG